MALPFECKRRPQLSTCSLVPSPPLCSRKGSSQTPRFGVFGTCIFAGSEIGRCVVIVTAAHNLVTDIAIQFVSSLMTRNANRFHRYSI